MRQAGIATQRLSNDDAAPAGPGVRFTTVHRAKGLEFKVVFVADCSSEELPLRSNLDRIADLQDREDVLACERQLLYVSRPRPRRAVRDLGG